MNARQRNRATELKTMVGVGVSTEHGQYVEDARARLLRTYEELVVRIALV